jgi:hypothetical protein
MKILYGIVLTIMIGGFIFFRALDAWIKYKNKKVGQKYCSDNGLEFIKAESYELHTRLYFQKDGIKSWANYETDRHYAIIWKKENPLEKLESLRQKNVGRITKKI